MSADISVEGHGSIVLLRPLTTAGSEWLEEHVESKMTFGNAIACEPRYVQPIIDGAEEEGLEVEV